MMTVDDFNNDYDDYMVYICNINIYNYNDNKGFENSYRMILKNKKFREEKSSCTQHLNTFRYISCYISYDISSKFTVFIVQRLNSTI